MDLLASVLGWMEYTYQIVVIKEFLTADELAAYEAEPIVLACASRINGALAKIMTEKSRKALLNLKK